MARNQDHPEPAAARGGGEEEEEEEEDVAWRGTALEGLASVENALRCPICQDFFRSPCSLKSCGHTFCSECLRRAIATKGECPACRKRCSTADLLPNKATDSIVRVFVRERGGLAAAARRIPPEMSTADPQRPPKRARRAAPKDPAPAGGAKEAISKRLPNVNFHMLKDKRLREMAAEHQLVSTGPRVKVVRRIKEYILLVNALFDGGTTITEADLARVRANVAAKEALLDRSTGPSILGGNGKKGTLPPVILNDAMRQLFARLRNDVIARDKIKRPRRKSRNKVKKALQPATQTAGGSATAHAPAPLESSQGSAVAPGNTTGGDASQRATAQPKCLSCGNGKRVSASSQEGSWRKVQIAEIPGFAVNYNEQTREVYLEPLANSGRVHASAVATAQGSGAKRCAPGPAATVDLLDSKSKDSFVEVVEDAHRPSSWMCQSCTFMNTDGMKLTCEICGTARPAAAASGSKLPVNLWRTGRYS